jgi:hypothetical protein
MHTLTVAELRKVLETGPDDYEIWTSQGLGSKGVVGQPQVDDSKRRATLP